MDGSFLVPAIGAGLALGALIAVDAGWYRLAAALVALVIGVGVAVVRGERRRLEGRHVR